jgi:hypothetical protein
MNSVNIEVLVSWTGLILELALLIVAIALHRRYFSNLSDIPGPFWASMTRLWHIWIILEGKQNLRLKALHRKHGQFVRIAPNEVSVCHPDGSKLLLGDDNLHKVSFDWMICFWYKATNNPHRVTGIVSQQYPIVGFRILCQLRTPRRRKLFRSTSHQAIRCHKSSRKSQMSIRILSIYCVG